MTVKELKTELEKCPDHMDIYLAERTTDFTFGLLNGIKQQRVKFSEEPNGKAIASDKVIILSEE